MRHTRLLPLILLATPFAFGQKKEVIELQRDVALLQDQVRTLQRALDEKTTALTVLMERTLDSINKANTAVAVLESGVREKLQQQERSVAAPVASVGAKVDQMAEEFRFLRESIADLNSRMQSMQTQLTDLKNAMTTIQAPPPPPTGAAANGTPPVGVSADGLYRDAMRDYSTGKFDIALAEFNDYLRWFPNTEFAPNAQFYIGMIHYNQQEWEPALQNFDMVLERFPENSKTLDAMYMKGMALLKSGQRTAAAQEFRSLIAKSPSSPVAEKAKAEMKKLGLSYSTPKKKK